MFKRGFVLKNSIDYDNAMFFSINVQVKQGHEILCYAGRITKHTDEAVYIDDLNAYFLKSLCNIIAL